VPDELARGCFYHEIKRCLGPCVGAVAQIEYSNVCADLVQLLQTGQAPQLDAMRAKMQKLSDDWKFEEAAQLKEQLAAIEAVAKRLQRLQRMRERNNVVIVQDARKNADELTTAENASLRPTSSTRDAAVFLIQGGVVRRHIVVRNWMRDHKTLRQAVTEVFDNPPPVADYTAKTELDEMMILDRWLKSNGVSSCCIWMNGPPCRQWTSNVLRGVQRWMNMENAD